MIVQRPWRGRAISELPTPAQGTRRRALVALRRHPLGCEFTPVGVLRIDITPNPGPFRSEVPKPSTRTLPSKMSLQSKLRVSAFHLKCPCRHHFFASSKLRVSGFHLKCPCKHHFLMCERVEGFGLPFKMSLRATVPLAGAYSKLQNDMGNYILGGVRNLSISYSQNDQKCTFGGSFGQSPFRAHCGLIFEEWERFRQPHSI